MSYSGPYAGHLSAPAPSLYDAFNSASLPMFPPGPDTSRPATLPPQLPAVASSSVAAGDSTSRPASSASAEVSGPARRTTTIPLAHAHSKFVTTAAAAEARAEGSRAMDISPMAPGPPVSAGGGSSSLAYPGYLVYPSTADVSGMAPQYGMYPGTWYGQQQQQQQYAYNQPTFMTYHPYMSQPYNINGGAPPPPPSYAMPGAFQGQQQQSMGGYVVSGTGGYASGSFPPSYSYPAPLHAPPGYSSGYGPRGGGGYASATVSGASAYPPTYHASGAATQGPGSFSYPPATTGGGHALSFTTTAPPGPGPELKFAPAPTSAAPPPGTRVVPSYSSSMPPTHAGQQQPRPPSSSTGGSGGGGGGGGGSGGGSGSGRAEASAPSDSTQKWPISLERYAIRLLTHAQGISQASLGQGVLKDMVSTAKADGSLWTIDWDTEPLPSQLFSKDSHASSLTSVAAAAKAVARSVSERVAAASSERSRWDTASASASASGSHASAPARSKRARWGPTLDANVLAATGQFAGPHSTSTLPGGGGGGVPPAAKRSRGGTGGESRFDPSASGANTMPLGQVATLPVGHRGAGERYVPESSFEAYEKRGKEKKVKEKKAVKPKTVTTRELGRDAEAKSVLQLVFGQQAGLAKEDWDALTVKGTCTTLEKRYFRLIEAPDPSTVRPQSVLERSLQHVLQRYRDGAEYKAYVNDQLKSIRQDMTVQRIRNDFSVLVYETHARIALENHDASEFNQCQTQLEILYRNGLAGQTMEFVAYRLMYYLYSAAHSDARSQLKNLTLEQRHHPYIRHAFDVRTAIATDNYHRFFALHRTAPNHGSYLMELLFHRVRITALRIIVDAYRPVAPVSFLTSELAFESEAVCRDLVVRAGGTLRNQPSASGEVECVLDCKVSNIKMIHELASTEEEQLGAAGLLGGDDDVLDQ